MDTPEQVTTPNLPDRYKPFFEIFPDLSKLEWQLVIGEGLRSPLDSGIRLKLPSRVLAVTDAKYLVTKWHGTTIRPESLTIRVKRVNEMEGKPLITEIIRRHTFQHTTHEAADPRDGLIDNRPVDIGFGFGFSKEGSVQSLSIIGTEIHPINDHDTLRAGSFPRIEIPSLPYNPNANARIVDPNTDQVMATLNMDYFLGPYPEFRRLLTGGISIEEIPGLLSETYMAHFVVDLRGDSSMVIPNLPLVRR